MPKSIIITLIKKYLRSSWAMTVGLLILCMIGFAPLIKSLGLYWDDWPSLWFLHTYGPKIFPKVFAIDRPVQGWLFVPTTWLFGKSLFAWQVFGILSRTLSAAAFGWALISLWPGRRLQVLGIAILFMLYPGFSQQYIAITYGHQFLIMSAFFGSLGLMIWSVRRKSLFLVLTALSLLIGILCMFALEYYFGLELLRPVLLWIVVGEKLRNSKQRLMRTIRLWLPYLVIDLLFLGWRITHSTPRGEITLFKNIAEDPITTLLELGKTITGDIYESAVLPWMRIFSHINTSGIKQSVMLAYFLVVIAAAVFTFILLLITRDRSVNRHETSRKDQWWRSAVILGFFALLVGGWPVWATDLRLELTSPWDRFTQPMMVGASLLLVGLIDLVLRQNIAKVILVAVLAGFSAGNHFHEAMSYRQEWTDQRSFFWQLAWRVPAVKAGTAFLTGSLPFFNSTDNSLTAPLNWIYAPALDSLEMPFAMYNIEARLGNSLPELEPNIPLDLEYRAASFHGTTSQALVFHYKPPRCLKILDLKTDRHYPNKGGYAALALPLSNLHLIQEEGEYSAMLPAFLGPEPKHNWCYYFEKVDLAVQLGHWQKASQLAEQALKTKPRLTSDNAPELIPLIYAFARSGDYAKAKELTRLAGSLSNKMHYYTCDTWFYLAQDIEGDPEFNSIWTEVYNEFECRDP